MTTAAAFVSRGANSDEDVQDVIVIGAGLSGIGAGYRLQEAMPDVSYLILEARADLGGTWDLFRYPGVRSDSDMYTLAFPFEPWRNPDSIAQGQDILEYLRHTACKHGIEERIRYRHRVTALEWSSQDACWTVTCETPEGVVRRRARFVHACSGYYSYETPHQAEIPGLENFAGTVVHPQFWPEGLDVSGRRVTVIGSGATAVTLVPSLVAAGAEVTMLQRTPTFVLSRPKRDPLAPVVRRLVGADRAHTVLRHKNIALQWASYRVARQAPRLTRRLLDAGVRRLAGRGHVASFTPPYDPWDQRLCLVPGGDLFAVLARGQARVVTDTIDEVVAGGVRTASGEAIPADVIVTATGLSVELLGGARVVVDGDEVNLGERLTYRGCMLEGVPNAALCVGYINASWGLRSDLSNTFVARMVRHLREEGEEIVVPTPPAGLSRRPLLEMDSGYLRRAAHLMPRKSDAEPWTMRQDYYAEARELRGADLTADVRFLRRSRPADAP